MSHKYNSRFISHPKTGKHPSKDLSIIILNAGIGKHTKSYGPKCLFKIDGQKTILAHQLEILTDCYPLAEIIVVGGFELFKIYNAFPNLKYAVNSDYENTTSLYSAVYGIMMQSRANTMIINGDLIFNKAFIHQDLEDSFIIIDTQKFIANSKVGVNHQDKEMLAFSYSSDVKWGQVLYLTNEELKLFKQHTICDKRGRIFIHEMVNEIIDKGAKFQVRENSGAAVIEIDTIKDIERVVL